MTAGLDAIVIGAGHNGLVCAAYLARAGLRTLVLERRGGVGGALGTVTLAPGVRSPDLAHSVGRLRPSVVRDLDLRAHRVRFVQPDARMTLLRAGERPLTLYGDVARTAAELARDSPSDAKAYPDFDRQTRALAAVLARIMAMTPPDPARPALSDLLGALRIGAGYRGLSTADSRALLRVLPMPIADHLDDWFAGEAMRTALAWRGVRYTSMGPRDAGTTQVFLADAAGTGAGAAPETVFVRGGPGALGEALAAAARSFGAEIRCRSEVRAIASDGERATGVELAGGESLAAPIVISGLDPKRTLLDLIDPALLGPRIGWQAANLRLSGAVSKVDLVLARLPAFAGIDDDGGRLRGRILLAEGLASLDHSADALKARRVATDLLLEATIPSLVDPSLVDAGSRRHVMSVLVQGTPYQRRDGADAWDGDRESLGDRVVDRLETVAPGLGGSVEARRVLTPLDLEREYGLTGGHPLHGEPSLDQWFAWRPMLGAARYEMPLPGLYLCGSGAHPGGGITGWPGANAARQILADRRRRR
ncbi:NAD(P)/FAD-dependent oxidoreductase [soil metagenome]